MTRKDVAAVYLYDDPSDLPKFLPFTQSRPIGELRYGAYLLRERLAAEFGEVRAYLSGGDKRYQHLAAFTEPGAPPVMKTPADGPRWLLRSSFVPELGLDITAEPPRSPSRLVTKGGAVVGAFVPSGERSTGQFSASWPAITVHGVLLEGAWQIIKDLSPALSADLAVGSKKRRTARAPAKCTVLGDAHHVLVDAGATVEPQVVFDVRSGPVWIQEGAEIRAMTRLAGPLVVGSGTRIVGGHVRESSIGPMCVVHGEVSNCIFLGHSNKSHDGFLGHSVVGRWVNLGAGTINSNLKNTYGTVRLNFGAERVETGMMFMGALIGDHVKTAIGTMLPTGCVVGTGANVFGSKRPESLVPAFAWGTEEPGRLVACRMFLQTAGRVLARRGAQLDDATRTYLADVWRHATGQPCD